MKKQIILRGALGIPIGVAIGYFITIFISVVWEIENWNLVKQTGIYFSIISALMMPIAYLAYWMEHSFTGFLSYLGIFILIFIFVWMVQFIIGRHNVKKMNDRLYKELFKSNF